MYASGILQVILAVICVISVFAKCSPVEANWNPTVQGTCWNENVFMGLNYTCTACTFISYMIQAWVPIHLALSLEGSKLCKTRWITLIMLAFWNILAGVLALVKLGYLYLYLDMTDPST